MKVHRFITPFSQQGSSLTILDPAVAKQMKQVLKLQVGETFVVPTEQGIDIVATIVGYDAGHVLAEVVREEKNNTEPVTHVRLFASILKREHFELVVQKATEIGVKEIIPLLCERTIKLGVKADRLAIIAKEAAELCGRSMVPVIHEPRPFRKVVTEQQVDEAQYFFDAGGTEFSKAKKHDGSVNLYIGPEGGWTTAERELAEGAGMTVISLGPLVLRGETACIVATYLGVSRL